MNDIVRLIAARLEAEQGVKFNKEQYEFITTEPSNIKSESLPGTGKTFSVINRMLVLELGYQIPGAKILAMSFTNMATAELEVKHRRLCKLFDIPSTPKFSTLHSICSQIVRENYEKLYIDSYSITEETYDVIASDCQYLQKKAAQELNINFDDSQIRKVYDCIRVLNSSLIFDPSHIKTCQEFIKLNISLNVFNHLRQKLYNFRKIMSEVVLSDLPLYTLELLQEYPEISEKYKNMYETVIVDEYQDMSLLQLRIVSLIAKQLIVIGDINQQIYAFQGACPEISDQFDKYYPDFKEIILKQSYRCAEEIADYATKIVLPNRFKSSKMFKGVQRDKTHIAIHEGYDDLNNIFDSIAYEYHTADIMPGNYMFLFRNNRSSIILSDMCYDRGIPCRVNNYKPLYKQPVMSDVMDIINLLMSPSNPRYLGALSKIITEFRYDRDYKKHPFYDIMENNPGLNFFDVPYDYNDGDAPRIMEELQHCKDLLSDNAPFIEVFNILYTLLYNKYLKRREFFLSYNLNTMVELIKSIIKNYTYQELITRETQKAEYIKDYTEKRIGVRLYTFHAAKGLEADHIYIIDAEEAVIPNQRELQASLKSNAVRDAAVTVRNERSLCYVACTRAKSTLDIFYNKELSTILQGENIYTKLDQFYFDNPVEYSDVEHFITFYNT